MEKIEIENENENKNTGSDVVNRWEQGQQRSKIFGGLIIVGIGCLYLLRETGFYVPSWFMSWQMLLIVVGMFVGIKHSFENVGWLIMILVGSIFMIREFMPDYDFSRYLWPIGIILVGLFVMLKPKRTFNNRYRNRWSRRSPWQGSGFTNSSASSEDFIKVDSVFGSVQKNYVTKNFKGGEINCVFAGAEINLSQSDIVGTVELEINSVFGGTKLVIPPHWELKSELSAVLGNVEDKRPVYKDRPSEGTKVLRLKGSAVFGSIEINSY